MGLGKPQPHAKFEVAGFIYYENICKRIFFNWDKIKMGNFLFLEKPTLAFYSQPKSIIFNVQLMCSCDCEKNGDFYEKPHFTIDFFLNFRVIR